MKISKQNMVISIASGFLILGTSAAVLGEVGLIFGPLIGGSVTAILWAYFSKKEKQQ